MKKKKKYTEEHKKHCVGILETSLGTDTVAVVAARLNVNKSTLYGWYKKYAADGERCLRQKKSINTDIYSLSRENNLLRRECELLRELTAVLRLR